MIFLWLLFFSPGANAISQEQILKTAWTDKTYLSYDEIQSTGSRNPLRAVEAIISQEKNTYEDNEVGLKFNFKSWPEWKMGTTKSAEQSLLKQSTLGWALKNRYYALLFYELNRQKSAITKEIIRLLEQYLQAQGLALRSGRVTTKSFLSTKADLYKFTRIKSALDQEISLLEGRMKQWLPEWKAESLQPMNLIAVQEIAHLLTTQAAGAESLTKKITQHEISQMEQELEVIKGRENQWIKGFEITRINRKDEDRYKVELTLQLPLFGSDDLGKQKQNDLILKKALKQRSLDEAADQLQILKVQILNLIEQYKSAQKIGNIKIHTLDPLVNTERQIIEQQEKLDMINQQREITTLYLDYLLESEILTKNPEKNYLDRDLKAIL